VSDRPVTPRLLVLCAIDDHPLDPLRRCTGQSRFLGEAGLWLAERGVDLICAAPGADQGFRPVPGAWAPAAVDGIDAVFDRDHGPTRDIQRGWVSRGIPVGNPPAFQELCDDKLAFARWAREAGLPVPETVPADDHRWRDWDGAFHKPRRGRQGVGVRRLAPGEEPGGGVVQRGVTPDHPGESIRLLLQRTPDGDWLRAGAFCRVARDGGEVAGLSEGAEAHPLRQEQILPLAMLEPVLTAALRCAPGAERILEVGVDIVLGPDGPAVLEWNARPGRSFDRIGRDDLRRSAVQRPFQVLLAWLL
jgi:YheC/D like ATP-grasp